jgi:Flp pilus assembly protein TadD
MKHEKVPITYSELDMMAKNGSIGAAVAELEAALSVTPDDVNVMAALGYALHLAECDQEAEDIYRRALVLDPENARLHQGLGCVLVRHDRYDEAIDAYNEAIRLGAADDEILWNDLGMALEDAGRVDESLQAYRQALALNPGHPEAKRVMGMLAFDDGEPIPTSLVDEVQAIAEPLIHPIR